MSTITTELLKSVLELTQLYNNTNKVISEVIIAQSEKIEELESRIKTLEHYHTYHGDEE